MAKAPTAPPAPPPAPPNNTAPPAVVPLSQRPIVAADTYAEGSPERAQYADGYYAGHGDAIAAPTSSVDDASFEDADTQAFKEGYHAGFAAGQSEAAAPTPAAPAPAEPFGGKGDHDKNGKVGGTAPIVKPEAAPLSKANSLDYDEGYRAGYKHVKTGVDQRDLSRANVSASAGGYNLDFKEGYVAGQSDATEGKDPAEDVRNDGEIAAEREQEATDGMSTGDRLLRIERTLGLRSPSSKA